MAGTPSPKISVALANAFLDGIGTLANSGKLRIYQGTQPATPETSIGASTQLAELTMNATAFPGASSHLLTANAIDSDTNTVAGTAQWFRLWKSDGTTPLMDGSVDTSGADMNLNSTAVSAGGTLAITSFTINLPVA
jgi:hypothetical protein